MSINNKNRKSKMKSKDKLKKYISAGIIAVFVIPQFLYPWSSDLLLEKEETIKKDKNIIQSVVVLPLSSSSLLPLPPVHINSSWIDNQWVPPPGYITYSADEIQNYFHQQSILIVGDSTARRMYSTLYGILNTIDNPDNIIVDGIDSISAPGINKKREQGFCRPNKKGYQACRKMPTRSSSSSSSNQSSTNRYNNYDLFYSGCLVELADIAKNHSSRLWTEWVQEYSLVIFVIGPHEVTDRRYCGARRHGRKNQTDDFFRKFFQNDDYMNGSNTTFVWRTWGIHLEQDSDPKDDEKFWNAARVHNAYVKTLIDTNEISRMEAGKTIPSSISYIDFGQAVLPRLYPSKKRIHGDISVHYGLELRLASVQMLMNHLVERDRQKKLMIHPWLSKDLITTRHGYNDTENFMTIGFPVEEPLIKPEEIEALKNAKASFCDYCMWSVTKTCYDKVEFMLNRTTQSRMLDVLVSVMTVPACNKSSEIL
jgi:hypothetical protein